RSTALRRHFDDGDRASGIAVHVCKALLNDAEQRGFGITGEPWQLGSDLDLHFDAATLLESFGVPVYGGSQAALVEQRGMQDIGESADFLANLGGDIAAIPDGFNDFGVAEIR